MYNTVYMHLILVTSLLLALHVEAYQPRQRTIRRGARLLVLPAASAQSREQLEPWLSLPNSPACTVDLELKNGAIERCVLRSQADVAAEAARVKAKHPTSPRDTEKVRMSFA